jgi:7-cyano-7-deazaguanine synthase
MRTGLLLSGGMDSIAIAYWKRPAYGFTVDYGQLSAGGEVHAAAQVCAALNILHEVITLDCAELGSGDLSDNPQNSLAPVSEWWPFRNQLLITVAAMRAVGLNINKLLFGSVVSDSMHADGRAEFFGKIDELLVLQEGGLRVEVPAIDLTTAELITKSQVPLSILGWAHSCHTSTYACGSCRGCLKHTLVMQELGYEES